MAWNTNRSCLVYYRLFPEITESTRHNCLLIAVRFLIILLPFVSFLTLLYDRFLKIHQNSWLLLSHIYHIFLLVSAQMWRRRDLLFRLFRPWAIDGRGTGHDCLCVCICMYVYNNLWRDTVFNNLKALYSAALWPWCWILEAFKHGLKYTTGIHNVLK